MTDTNYLEWLSSQTRTAWWHDSADPAELKQGKEWGAVGVTTNPVLVFRSLDDNRNRWNATLKETGATAVPREKAEILMRSVVVEAASEFELVHRESGREHGYVCAQLDPTLAADREAMIAMARRFAVWAPNVSVKFPATAAGLDALEECVSEGICATSTVSFTVAQVVAAAERYERGRERAERAGLKPSPCFAVIMIGRIDDYLRDVALDQRAQVSNEDIQQAGLAITKRAYSIFRKNKYRTKLLVAALRGPHHMTGVCGGELVMSLHPKIQKLLVTGDIPRATGIDEPVPKNTLKRLQTIPEFVKAYEPEEMLERDFMSFGVTQKTLSQFNTEGWSLLERVS